jgi:hypothetical protein
MENHVSRAVPQSSPAVAGHTPGPWEYVPSTEHHGPYVSGPFGGDVCDCYVMSKPSELSTRNGGASRPIHHQGEEADANARLIAAAPEQNGALRKIAEGIEKQVPATRHYLIQSGIDAHFADVLLSHYLDFARVARAAIAKAIGGDQ